MSYLHYGEPAYWEERYKFEQNKSHAFTLFDWYCRFDEMFPLVESLIDMEVPHKVLLIGIGRSNTIDVLYAAGFRDIHAIDISETVIFNMQEKYKDHNGVSFSVMDVRELNGISDQLYSLVIEKACIDAVFCSTNFLSDTRQAFKEIYRVLKDHALFISVSHAPPPTRVPFLRSAPWAIDTCSVPHGESIQMYILTRLEAGEKSNKAVEGAEAVLQARVTNTVSNLDNKAHMSSTTKNSGASGLVTVTASVDILAEMVNDSEDRDS